MEVSVLEGRTFNGVTIGIALIGLIVAAFALVYGRRAVFPPRRRLTVYVHSGRGPASSMVTISNTGRHAVESARFDRDRPFSVDLGVPLQRASVVTAPRPDIRTAVRGSAVEFGPDLLNPGESVVVEVFGEREAARRPERLPSGHVLIDTVVETRRRPPPGPLRRYVPRIALALPLIYLLAVAWANGRYDALDYFVSAPNATISPDHGGSHGCITIRGTGFGRQEDIEVITFDFPPATDPGYAAPAGCPALTNGRAMTRSSVKGEVYFTFSLPPGCSGQLTIYVAGDRYDAATYWVV